MAVVGDEFSAQPGAGLLRRVGGGPGDLLVGEEPAHPPGAGQPVVEALVLAQIVVLQVDQSQPGRIPVQAVAAAVGLQQLQLGHPIDPVGGPGGIFGQVGQHVLPGFEHLGGLGVRHSVRKPRGADFGGVSHRSV